MTTSTVKVRGGGLTRYWPFAVGGFVAPIAAAALARWIPLHFAVGGTMFVAFTAAAWLFNRTNLRPVRRSLRACISSGLAAGLVAGLLAFLFPWR